MEQHFQRFRKQRTTSRGIPKFSKIFSPEGSFPFTSLSEFLEFSVKWFAFNFRNFWKPFPAIPVPFTPVFKFWKVLVEWKARRYYLLSENRNTFFRDEPFHFLHSPNHRYPSNSAVSSCSSALRTFRQEERLRFKERSSTQMT